ncbi:hypothetical protein CcrKarma_gp201 [Caulobacter virus Karma]|uniref:Uncharacterized protein n=1 Tax=Caulobacter phage CcrSwift TaxID=2927984 RepID=K4JT45_9CAUD|nr:hypothetical protein CcrMagneto_gp197 [Caulobacter virus Magneto]YP_006989581.1 hypothetical protein CcrKarma_gp201 [Caulobacter virus Karma]YP_006989929.1 hypothetical protein D870_gp225 [Caulobacter phage CcrSwift]ARB14413.1 hypothetical protein Ccr5_gp193c [Caulobacter phage Ccr5]AFU87367.1 hypothetical protein CcrMagneto_gp197 [Caulobacter virus Magneto]AFU87718.1 hypothetical protein CcrKarma_gp201 [Caulobacter virus Karma]AFU88514.1 hypothetical protein CcrSwift_gp196 [Caulobacter ph
MRQPEGQSCKTCRFFLETGAVQMHGDCRRFPPSIKVGPSRYHPARTGGSFHGDNPPDQIGWAEFPLVHMNSWCGEWKPETES